MAVLTVMATVGTSAAALAGASPAQADASDCTSYLSGAGYTITLPISYACSEGASGQAGSYIFCREDLTDLGVTFAHASQACQRAGWASPKALGRAAH